MTVYLVGAGPGDPGLLTRRGAELLARADVVVYDRLAHPSLLDLAPAGAVRIDVGKAPGRVAMDQDGINATLVEHGRTGACVVRLKGGDPFVFGRGGEEAEVLIGAGVPFEVVPGITSAIAAPAYAGIPVTHRGLSTHFTVVTGHEDPAKGSTDTDWASLARAGGTLIILMGAGRLESIVDLLIEHGRSPDTPVAAVRWGTRPEQATTRATLSTITALGVASPSAIVVGPVAGLDLTWFESRPLFGRTIVVTRAREQSSSLRTRLEELGASVLELPTIEIAPLPVERPAIDRYAWIVFTSVNAVDGFFERGLRDHGLDTRSLGPVQVAAIGPGTTARLGAHGVVPDLIPERSVAESLLEAFPPGLIDDRVLLPRAETARDVLPEGLQRLGYDVDVLPIYRTVTAIPNAAKFEVVHSGAVDAVTFTSASTVNNFCDAVGSLPEPAPLVVSIGPITSAAARERGLTVGVEADPHSIDGLVAALLSALGAPVDR
ncbi:MAG: uroporphyrinogen-III C-methyltransferase [Acidimicrobiia bacterium]|nr:uroporphyrinogen-III C-methyltransferase [Acidimicrobiia bacterium]